MNKKERIATYFSNAQLLIMQNNPKAARSYVLALLNEALEAYQAATTILSKARTAVFMERWIAVSRDLYEKGITDYVLECFILSEPQGQPLSPRQSPVKKQEPPEQILPDAPGSANENEVNMAGLVDEAAQTQGWCATVFEANKNAVAEITVTSSMGESSGTGFIISDKGYLLTNDHVVFDVNSGVYYSKVGMSLGTQKKIKLEVLFSDKNADIALCKFNPDEVKTYSAVKRIADYTKLKQGADCLVIGNAFGMGLAPFTGIVRFTKNDSGNLVYTAPSNPGDSGGPVFDRNGMCIGMNKSKTVAINNTVAEAYANATPMDKIDELIKKWTSNNNIVL